jgi:hypothetical protein
MNNFPTLVQDKGGEQEERTKGLNPGRVIKGQVLDVCEVNVGHATKAFDALNVDLTGFRMWLARACAVVVVVADLGEKKEKANPGHNACNDKDLLKQAGA